MRPLAVKVSAWGSTDELSSNIRSCLDRKLPELSPALCSHDGTFVIAGSGPSLPSMLEAIKVERTLGRPVCALNGAHDFLIKNEFTPNLFVTTDPRDTIIGNTSLKSQDVIYLLASRCSPKLFDHLKDHKVMVWHSWSPDDECEAFRGHFAIGGGTTSGTRSIYIGYVMGYRKFSIYGMDSCLADDGITKRFSGEKAGKTVEIFVGENKRRFISNLPMAQQAEEIQSVMNTLTDISIEFHGDGLLSAIWAERRKMGLPA